MSDNAHTAQQSGQALLRQAAAAVELERTPVAVGVDNGVVRLGAAALSACPGQVQR